MNVEHRTSNIEHRIMNSVYLKRLTKRFHPSTFDIRYSTRPESFDPEYFNPKFTTKGLVAGCGSLFRLNVVSYERRRWPERRPDKSKKKLMNVEHRTSNVEHRIMNSVYLKRFSEAIPPFDIRYSIFCGSLFQLCVVSYERRLWPKKRPV